MAVVNAVGNTLQSPFTLGATSVTSTGTQLNYLAALTAVPINKIVTQTITATGTYTPTTGMLYALVEIVGAGAGGSGIDWNVSNNAGSGGGGGGYARKLYSATEIGVDAAVTIGAAGGGGAAGFNNGTDGGSSIFNPAGTGATITANGGTGGTSDNTNWTLGAWTCAGGAGGTATGGDVNISGSPGQPGMLIDNVDSRQLRGGQGGDSFFGRGGIRNPGVGAGSNGVGFGAGGSGPNASGADLAGGDGTIGWCIVTEFLGA